MILLLTCTYNRLTCLKRLVRFYIDQDYRGESFLFIYNNSPIHQKLDTNIKITRNKTIILENNSRDLKTGRSYKDVGSIHRDALELASSYCIPDVVTFFEDDNFYMRNHISEGMKGMNKAYSKNMLAYKPLQSYLNGKSGISLQIDNFEPSFFVDYEFLKEHGFKNTSVSFHYGWIEPLFELGKLFIDKKGEPTLIYNWGTSNLSAQRNDGMSAIINHRAAARDIGNGIIEPISKEEVTKYYSLVPKEALFKRIMMKLNLKSTLTRK